MKLRTTSPDARDVAALSGGASAVTVAVWIAICAAAPEIIWQGFRLTYTQLSWTEVGAALLTGMILAFFVEPLMQTIREVLERAQHRPVHHRSSNVLFAASLALAFAIASVFLHSAMIAFVSRGAGGGAHEGSALVAGLGLTAAWAIGPFTITLAWLGQERRALAVPLGVLAVLSPLLAGWLFSWDVISVVSTAIPALAILGLGYWQGGSPRLRHHAGMVLWVGIAWLLVALVVDEALGLLGLARFDLYDPPSFWVDARFYLGWALGLLLAPTPHFATETRPKTADP
ncbi:MAG TPA: hypothetical protein VL356_05830 [Acidocella sp.]|nr:hypothetical protein [Acidocella sp.]